jgi:hypothetical protein
VSANVSNGFHAMRIGASASAAPANARILPFAANNTMLKAPRTLTFKCAKCSKSVQVFLQKVSACSHIQPYQGICQCGEVKRHATGQKDAVQSYLASPDGSWTHHH